MLKNPLRHHTPDNDPEAGTIAADK